MCSKDEAFDVFLPIAKKVAQWIKNEHGELMRLYEEDDLISWAWLSQDWPKYKDNPGAMRVIIKFAMLRALEVESHYGMEIDANLFPEKEVGQPCMKAIIREIKDLVEDEDVFTREEKGLLLRRVWKGESCSEISRSTGQEYFQLNRKCRAAVAKLRRVLHE